MKIYHSVVKLRAPTKFKEHTYHELAIQIRKYYMEEHIRDLESQLDLIKGDIKPVIEEVLSFLKDVTSPEMYGHIVPLEVRKRAVALRDSINNSYVSDL